MTKPDREPSTRKISILLPPHLVSHASAMGICVEITREHAVFYTTECKHEYTRIAGLVIPGFALGNEQLTTPYQACVEMIYEVIRGERQNPKDCN